jgi:RNA recognition motif-containing protein
MARNSYSAGKRKREQDRAKKKKEKAQRRQRTRDSGTGGIEIASADDIQGGLLSIEEVVASVHKAGGAGHQSARIPVRLFVGGLSWQTGGDELRALFEKVGPVVDAVLVLDRDTGDSRGFGFVTMADRKDAATAMKSLDGTEFDGRTLVVNLATERNR